ncbi:MAG: hypothetical protein N3G19_01350 [Candidatus Pacearchaeota archaeon]|nr:hypothetical protein [Candidatus Pacearchaeota archaeon]
MKVKVNKRMLESYLKPLLKFKNFISAIYIYGSAVTKQEANDIDTLIIINDSGVPPAPQIIDLIEKTCGTIEERGKKQGLTFHFQPLKPLSKWWYLVLDGEPWIVSSLKQPWIIYDKKGLVTEVSRLVNQELIYRKEEKAEKLMDRSDSYFLKNRRLLLDSLRILADAATEASQILLLFDNKLILNKRRIIEELEKNYIKEIGDEIVGNYKEIIDLEEKMEKGALSEFTAENLDYYLDKTKRFIAKVEAMLSKK